MSLAPQPSVATLGSLSANGRVRAAQEVAMHPPADRRIALEQPRDQIVVCAKHRNHDRSTQMSAILGPDRMRRS
jgi:hypothetical protein